MFSIDLLMQMALFGILSYDLLVWVSIPQNPNKSFLDRQDGR